jgi:hypothetical protein
MHTQSFVESPAITQIFDKPGVRWTLPERIEVKEALNQPAPLRCLLLIALRRLGRGATAQDAEDAWTKYVERRLDADIDKYHPDKGLRFWPFVRKWFEWFCQDEGKTLRKQLQRQVSLVVETGEGVTIELELVDEHASHDPERALSQKQFLTLLNR